MREGADLRGQSYNSFKGEGPMVKNSGMTWQSDIDRGAAVGVGKSKRKKKKTGAKGSKALQRFQHAVPY